MVLLCYRSIEWICSSLLGLLMRRSCLAARFAIYFIIIFLVILVVVVFFFIFIVLIIIPWFLFIFYSSL